MQVSRLRLVPFLAFATPAVAQVVAPPLLISDTTEDPIATIGADLNGDGRPDLVTISDLIEPGDAVTNLRPDELSWRENLGNASFGPKRIISTSIIDGHGLHAADLDGDGDVDLLTTSGVDNKVAWYENQQQGTFLPQAIIDRPNWPSEVDTADVDGDLDLDVLVGDVRLGLGWYENLGGGGFGPRRTILSNMCIISFAPADVDGDGDIDVVAGDFWLSNFGWSENLGGTFGPYQIIEPLLYSPVATRQADLDGDGDPDIVVASVGDGRISTYENLGGGSFGPRTVIHEQASWVWDTRAGDIDADGDLDIVTSAIALTYNENLGNGTFAPPVAVSHQVQNPLRVAFSDLDLDGDNDLVTTPFTYDENEIVWLENVALAGVSSCDALPNSTGLPGVLTARGSANAIRGDLVLQASQMIPFGFGYAIVSRDLGSSMPPGAAGILCLTGNVGRYNRVTEMLFGEMDELELDLESIPTNPPAAVLAGETWHFQAWYRDGQASNFTNSLSVGFH
ncbi:MAG: VCBS repeat-containing protein [bacterium]|nr:VCBS repeat-containing protein [bacterium]